MNKFCPESCLFAPECVIDCHHKYDIVYSQPIPAVINYRRPMKIEIIGENSNVICNYYGTSIGPTWYVRNERGEVSGIIKDNPLVTFEGQEYIPPEPKKWTPPEYKESDKIKKKKRKKHKNPVIKTYLSG